jgi:hypothetical protein
MKVAKIINYDMNDRQLWYWGCIGQEFQISTILDNGDCFVWNDGFPHPSFLINSRDYRVIDKEDSTIDQDECKGDLEEIFDAAWEEYVEQAKSPIITLHTSPLLKQIAQHFFMEGRSDMREEVIYLLDRDGV